MLLGRISAPLAASLTERCCWRWCCWRCCYTLAVCLAVLLSCWLQLSIEDKCSIVGGNLCADGVRALVYGAQQMASFNKTMSLRDAHTALAPFSRVSQPALHSVPTQAQIIMSTLRYII